MQLLPAPMSPTSTSGRSTVISPLIADPPAAQ
jgi:hypothetical protein